MPDESGELVTRASAGDSSVLPELVRRYLPGLRRYVRHHAGGLILRREASEDLVQSACREMLERLADERYQFQGEAQFRQWLYQAALFKIQDRRRYHGAQRRDPDREARRPQLSSAEALSSVLFHDAGTPSEAAARRERIVRLQAALEQLPERYRTVLDLAYRDELPHEEIAARLDITPQNSRVLLSRALSRLARLGVEQEEGGPD
ncbi:MAG: sigma-70 family RNA polymerase sigma factor [Planctomycetota bacterium]|nr:MAG: sigma-70 family RNA polymerase sigma factor [Planctomycetota bacterium]